MGMSGVDVYNFLFIYRYRVLFFSNMEDLKKQLKSQIISALNLQDVKPEDITDDETLFKGGLGLDSIDVLELIVLMDKEYGITIADAKDGKTIFATINSMAEYIQAHRTK